jgi:lipoprotein-releasing system permease protein
MGIPGYVFFVGLRYFLVKRRDHFVSFISTVSILGIALGVAVLITVLSVFNGFSKEIRAKILSITPHITLRNYYGPLKNWQSVVDNLKNSKQIVGVAPYISDHGLLAYQGYTIPVVVLGIDTLQIENVYPLNNNIVIGSLSELIPEKFNVILGQDLANNLAIHIYDEVALIIPQVNISPLGVMPRIKKFKVVGIFKSNTQYDQHHIFLNISDASKLYKLQSGITGIQIKLLDDLSAKKQAYQISEKFSHKYFVSDWTQDFNAFFEAIKMQKTVTWCILLLIVAVAAFNLVSSLIMLVTDKRPDIAILRVMGASSKEIMLIFMIQGTAIGIIGTISGLIIGLLLAYNITDLVNFIQNIFNVKFISEEAYFIGFVPSDIHVSDILWICGLSLFMSIIATLYPAWRASNVKPAEALRYE